MKKFSFVFLLGLILFSFVPVILAEDSQESDSVVLHFFYGKGCPHCAKGLDFLDSLKDDYPLLIIKEHETYSNQSERELFEQMTAAFGEKIEGVPTTFVDNRIIVGFSDSISVSIEDEIKKCLRDGCCDPVDKIKDDETIKLVGDKTTAFEKLTVPAVISAAIVDAINPCAFAV